MVRNPYLTLAGTEEECSYSPGSVKTVKVARAEEVVSVPVLEGEAPITQRPVAYFPESFVEYHFRPDSVLFSESGKQTAAGMKYEQRVRGIHPGTDSAGFYEIARLMDGHYILIIELYSGPIRLLGTTESPFQFTSDFTTGDKLTDTAASTWEFFGESNAPAPTLADIVVTTASPCALLSPSDFLYQPWEINSGANYRLDKIFVEENPGGLISSITSHPDGILYDNTNAAVDTVEWNVGGWYEPANGPWTIIGTWRVIIPDIAVSTGSPSTSCNHTFNQPFSLPNSPPQLTFVGWLGTFETGETLTALSVYYDVDGDSKNLAAINAAFTWWHADDAIGTNETQIDTGISYVLDVSDEGKYIQLRGIPHANTGATPGAEARSVWYGPLSVSNFAPVAANLVLASNDGILMGDTTQVMAGIQGTYTVDLSDADADALVLTNAAKIYMADDAIETNITLITNITPTLVSGNQYTFNYTVPSGYSGKYMFVKVTAASAAGISPGNTVSIYKPVLADMSVVLTVDTFTDNISGTLFKVAFQNGKSFYLKKFNDIATLGSYTVAKVNSATGQPEQVPVVFSTNGLQHRLEIWGYPAEFYSIHANGYDFRRINMHASTSLRNTTQAGFYITSQPNLSNFTVPTATGANLSVNLNTIGYTGSLNMSAWQHVIAYQIANCSFSSIVNPTTTAGSCPGIAILEFDNNDGCTGIQDFTGIKFQTTITRINVVNNLNITELRFPTLNSSYTVNQIWIYLNPALIRYGIDDLVIGGYVRLHFNSAATDFGNTGSASIVLSPAANQVTSFELEDHTTTQNIDISTLGFNTSNNKFIQDNTFGTITWPASWGTLPAVIQLNNNHLDVNLPAASSFTNVLNDNNFRIEIKDTTIPAANMNEFLVNFEALSNGTATGRTINIDTTAYDSSSGGFNGSAALTALNAKGWTVIT